jgi:glycosyltransferase involved in cell wall biosynthesis
VLSVAIVSTFPPSECGIANYSRELVTALARCAPDLDVHVIAERTARISDQPGVMPAWDRRADWGREALDVIERVRPDIVHVQHEESIFGNRRLVPFVRALAALRIRSVVTLHTVHAGRRLGALHAELASVCDRLVVHQHTGMASVLEAQGVSRDRIEVIAHGTPVMPLPSRREARELLALPHDVPIALFFGFIHFRKRLHVAVRGFEHARVPDARLVIAGRIRTAHAFDHLYATYLRRKLRAGIAGGRIVFRPGFVASELKAAYFAAANVIVLPHDQPYGSASGVLHEALATRRPILCTRGKKFAEAAEAFAADAPELFPPAGNVTAWQRGFEHLLLDPDAQARASELAAGLAERTSWLHSAERHAAMYRAIDREISERPASQPALPPAPRSVQRRAPAQDGDRA